MKGASGLAASSNIFWNWGRSAMRPLSALVHVLGGDQVAVLLGVVSERTQLGSHGQVHVLAFAGNPGVEGRRGVVGPIVHGSFLLVSGPVPESGIPDSPTGKTHMDLGLGLAACQKGMSVGFTTAAALVHELMEARDERRLLNLQRQLSRLSLLIIDELGFVPLSPTGAELLFEVFSQRYERGSILVTTNLDSLGGNKAEWTEPCLFEGGLERLTRRPGWHRCSPTNRSPLSSGILTTAQEFLPASSAYARFRGRSVALPMAQGTRLNRRGGCGSTLKRPRS